MCAELHCSPELSTQQVRGLSVSSDQCEGLLALPAQSVTAHEVLKVE